MQSQIESLLRQRRRLSGEDDFNVRDMAEIAATMASATGAMTALLGAIAGVSLLVGGWFAAGALEVPFVILPQIVLVAFLFSAAVGIVFGILPARRASRLNPIEALRHE